jgi:hypothetical protein
MADAAKRSSDAMNDQTDRGDTLLGSPQPRQPWRVLAAAGVSLALVVLVGCVDYLTGLEVSVTLL